MKIVQVVHSFPPKIGGVERHAYELCIGLRKIGEEVVVHTTGKRENPKEPCQVKRHWGLRIPFFSSVIIVPFLGLRLVGEDADVYASHGYGSLMPVCTAFAAMVKGKPFVFTVHGYPELSGFSRIAQWIYRNTFARFVLWKSSKVIVVSRESKKHLTGQVDKKRLVYIPNGVDPEMFECPPFSEGEYLSYIGRMDKDKRIGMLINAVGKMKKRQKLLVAGNDEGERPGLKNLADNLGLEAEFTQVEPQEISQVYCYSKAVVLPSRYEGFSLVWLEAMAAGRPMFSTPVGQAPELFREVYGEDAEKFLFPDEDGLVDRLEYFVEHEKEFIGIVERAKKKVAKDYSWKAMAEKTMKVYEDAIKEEKK
ncbi:glycosyltransferase [Candidatus Micrarchaeota archaeon]|nr:glycosyltransferase [Candidatus Micrarchaeota archaeon]MBD3417900.1 glycosyltransferase [Candidatus Micrarchaeota archaeon]